MKPAGRREVEGARDSMRPDIAAESGARRVAARAQTSEPVERATPAKDAIGRMMTAADATKLIEGSTRSRRGRQRRRFARHDGNSDGSPDEPTLRPLPAVEIFSLFWDIPDRERI